MSFMNILGKQDSVIYRKEKEEEVSWVKKKDQPVS